MPAQASQSSELHVSGVEILVGGAQVAPEVRNALVDVKVTETLSLPASATIRITDSQMAHIDSASLAIGKEVEIKMGAMSQRSTQSIFKGEITAIEPNFSESGCELILRALDKSHRLQRNRAVKAWQQTKASDIVSELCREAGIGGSSTATTVQYEFFMRKGETPRELIARFERDYNYRFWLVNGQYKFQPAVPTGAAISMKLRENLMSFRPRASVADVSNEVVVRGWDPKAKQEITGQLSSPQVKATSDHLQPRYRPDRILGREGLRVLADRREHGRGQRAWPSRWASERPTRSSRPRAPRSATPHCARGARCRSRTSAAASAASTS